MRFSVTFLFLENVLFFCAATLFLIVVDRAWNNLKPFEIPKPLPGWFKIWFGTIQIIGGILPLIALLLWGVWWHYPLVAMILLPYLLQLGLQIASEYVTHYRWRSTTWVMVPYLYLPFRFWQLNEGLTWLDDRPELIWIRYLLIANLVAWIGNYLLDLAQLPRLFRWPSLEDETPPS